MARTGKPWFRPRNIVLAVVAVIGATICWVVLEALTAKPGELVDYQKKLVELVESYQPGGSGDPNAWDSFASAAEIFQAAKEELIAAAGGPNARPSDWPNFGWPYDFSSLYAGGAPAEVVEPTLRMASMLRERGVREHLAAMAATPRSVRGRRPSDEWVISLLLPELGSARDLARWCAARMHEAVRTGDTTELVASFEQGLALGRVVGSQWTIIERLTGIAIVALMTGELRREVAGGTIDAATCRELLAAIDRQLPLPPMELALTGERLGLMDAIQRTHTDNGRGSGRLIITKIDDLKSLGDPNGPTPAAYSHPIFNIVGLFMPSRAETVRMADTFYDTLIAFSRKTPAERRTETFNPDVFVESLPRGYFLLRMLLPALGKAIVSNDRCEVDVAGVRVMLALEVHHQEHGAYPARLEDLVPSILPELPLDPFSGKPYGYKLFADGGRGRGSYSLFSVGADGVDDGGVPHAEHPQKALQGTDTGSDYIIHEPKGGGR